MAANVNKQPDEAQAPEPPQYRKVSEDELRRILTDHQEWLETNGEKGTQADLQGADLRRANTKGRCR